MRTGLQLLNVLSEIRLISELRVNIILKLLIKGFLLLPQELFKMVEIILCFEDLKIKQRSGPSPEQTAFDRGRCYA